MGVHRILGLAFVAGWLIAQVVRADDYPQWLGPKRDGVWRESGVVDKFPAGGLKVRWRTPVGGGYAGPAVAAGRVYLTDRVLAPATANPESGFVKKKTPGKERVLCLDDATGKVVWQHEYECEYRVQYPAGPRATPLVADGKVYTLGTMGDLLCLDCASGAVVWSKNFVRDYQAPVQTWGFACHPLLEGDKLICLVGGESAGAVAFHKDTGKEIWKGPSVAEIGYAPPTMIEHAGRRQLIIWHPGAVDSLDPETGKLYWSQPFELRAGLSISTPRISGDQLFVTAFYNGPMMLKLDPSKPAATVQWRGKGKGEKPGVTDGLHAIMCTPVFRDGYIYGICSYGELRCLNADTGARVWESLEATGSKKGDRDRWNNAFLIPHGDRFFLFNERGELIIARLTPKGYEEVSRTKIIEPTNEMPGRPVVWMHPAFANKSVYARNDKEIVCVSLAAEQ
jgi:outer membrane protein assembly factor BamB